MGLFSKKKKTVIVVESSTEKTESTARKDNASYKKERDSFDS